MVNVEDAVLVFDEGNHVYGFGVEGAYPVFGYGVFVQRCVFVGDYGSPVVVE